MDRLARSLREVTQDPTIKEKLAPLGVEPSAQDNLSTSQVEEFVQAETARWRSMIEAAGVSAD